jgi:hypothetical protein
VGTLVLVQGLDELEREGEVRVRIVAFLKFLN